jgi:hypothetical protein
MFMARNQEGLMGGVLKIGEAHVKEIRRRF